MKLLPALAAALVASTPARAQDVPTVDANGDGAWSSPRLVEELRIGRLDGPDEYIFGSVSGLAVHATGTIMVVDGQGPRVRLYSPDGQYLRDVGRDGEGPGEYRGVVGVAVTPSGDFAVYDVSLRRVSLFDPAGEYLRSFRTQSGSWIGDAFRVDTAGNFMVFTARYTTRTDAQGREIIVEGEGSTRTLYLVHSPSGEVTDSIAIPRSTLGWTPSFVVMTNEGNLQPFVNRLTYALSPHGYLVSGYTSEYGIVRLDRNAEPVARFVRDYEPVRLNREERAQWQGRADYYTRRGGRASAGVQIPELKPAFRDLAVDEDGRIWVHRYAPAVEHPRNPDRAADLPPELTWRDKPTFDVFEPNGRFLGTIEIPPRTYIMVRRGRQLWGVTRGEFDEPYVVRYRLETGSAPDTDH